MESYPVLFSATAKANSGVKGSWQIHSGAQTADCAVPQEFGGEGGGFSPEDLFAQALTNCFLATFKIYAQASKVEFGHIEVNSTLEVDKIENNKPTMARCNLEITVTDAKRPDRLEILVEKALKAGFILNSVNTQIEHTLKFI